MKPQCVVCKLKKEMWDVIFVEGKPICMKCASDIADRLEERKWNRTFN